MSKEMDEAMRRIKKRRSASIERVRSTPAHKSTAEGPSEPKKAPAKQKIATGAKKVAPIKVAAAPKAKAPPKPAAPTATQVKAAKTTGRIQLRRMPVRGPKGAFRMTAGPTGTERAALRYRGASYKAHVQANRPAPAPKAPGKLRVKAAERKAGKKAAKAAWKTKYQSKGIVGKTAMRTGKALGGVLKVARVLGRVSAVTGGISGAVDIGRLGYRIHQGMTAQKGLQKQARVLKDSGYKVTIPNWSLSRAWSGDVGMKIGISGKPRKRTVGAAPPRLRRR